MATKPALFQLPFRLSPIPGLQRNTYQHKHSLLEWISVTWLTFHSEPAHAISLLLYQIIKKAHVQSKGKKFFLSLCTAQFTEKQILLPQDFSFRAISKTGSAITKTLPTDPFRRNYYRPFLESKCSKEKADMTEGMSEEGKRKNAHFFSPLLAHSTFKEFC